MDQPFAVLFLTSLVVTYFTMPFVRSLGAAFGLLDHPERRKLQRAAVPRAGGIGILLGLGAGTVLLVSAAGDLGFPLGREALAIGIGALIVHLTGVLDDLLDVPARLKLVAQVGAVSLAMSQGIVIETISWPGGPTLGLGIFAIPLTAFFLLGFINSLNLIDGLDGLAAGVAGVGAFALGIAGVLGGNFVLAGTAAILAGAVLGFLPWNFRPKGKTFLGDAGSMLLGYSLGVTAIAGARFAGDSTPLMVVLAAATFPILDTATTIARRVRKRQGVFRPDSMHIHHRMIRFGLSPRRTVATILLLTLFVSGQALAFAIEGAGGLLVVSTLAAGLAVYGVWRSHRRDQQLDDAGFRDVVSYLLGAQDGSTARTSGELSLVDILTGPAPGTVHTPAATPPATTTKVVPLRKPVVATQDETSVLAPLEKLPVE